jgi:hypothetical protein
MPRKKSVKLAAQRFSEAADIILEFFEKTQGLQEEFHSWCTDYAVIRLYFEFEVLMLSTLVGAINNDTETLSQSLGFDFPKHMSQDVCTYLIIGTGYFDFKGRDGLIQLIKAYVPDAHYLVAIVKDAQYKDSLEQLSALRNFAAHQSAKAKKAAIKAIGGERIASSGSWLRRQDRFKTLCESLKKLAHDIEKKAPY